MMRPDTRTLFREQSCHWRD